MHKLILPRRPNEDLQEFQNFIAREVNSIVPAIARNPEFQKIIEYFKSDDFKNIILILDEVPAYTEVLNYVQASGLDVYGLVNTIRDLLELVPLPVPPKHVINSLCILFGESMKDMEKENWSTDGLSDFPELKALVDHILGQKFQSIVQSLSNIPEYHKMKQKLCDYGIDVDKIVYIIRALFCSNDGKVMQKIILPSGPNEHLQDFLHRLPQNEVVFIVLGYMANIPEFPKFINYVKSDDFKNIILILEQVPAYIWFLSYVQISLFDIYTLVNTIHDILDLAPLPVPSEDGHNNLSSMANELSTIIPHEQHKGLFEEIMNFSPELRALNDYICGQEFQRILQSLENRTEYQEMKQKLHDKGIDVDKLVYLFKALFGLNSRKALPQPILPVYFNEHLQNILCLNLMGHNDPDYIAKNLPLKKIMEYFTSDDFKKIILILNKVPAYIEILNYVQAFGLDVYRLVNTIYQRLKLDPLPIPLKYGFKSLSSRLNKIITIIPHEQIKVLFEKKLKTIPELKAFYDHICGQEFQSLVQGMVNHPAYPYWKKGLQCEAGIDVEPISDITQALFCLNIG